MDRKSARMSWPARILLSLLGLGMLMIFLLWLIALRGEVVGEEFSPDTFNRRTFHYWEFPYLGFQLSSISRAENCEAMESFLLDNKYIVASPTAKQWDLIEARRGSTTVLEGDAAVLCLYLDAEGHNGKLEWQTWSEAHPKLAAVLWPAVARVVRGGHYVRLPELFHAALATDEPNRLQSDVDAIVSREND